MARSCGVPSSVRGGRPCGLASSAAVRVKFLRPCGRRCVVTSSVWS